MPTKMVRSQKAIIKSTGWITAILVAVLWGFPISPAMAETNLKVTQATWSANAAEAKITGTGADRYKQVLILDASTGQQIGSVRSGRTGNFVFDKKGLNPVPCKFTIKGYDGRSITSGYTSSPPADCSAPVSVTLNGISINGPTSVNESSSADYTVNASYSDGSSKSVSSGITWTESSASASINSSGHLVTTAVTANQIMLVSATYSGKSASLSVTIRNVSTTPTPTPTPTPPPSTTPLSGTFQTFAVNDLGMHCYDPDFSVFSILPVYNIVHAQVVQKGTTPKIMDATVDVKYSAMADATGSINTTSAGKTNFWTYVAALFGANPPVDTGLMGAKMPGSSNQPQPFSWEGGTANWFSAAGIPITAFDDKGKINTYPLMNVQAMDPANSKVLSSLPTVVPISNEMACNVCHNTGNVGARLSGINWSQNQNPAIQFRENILLLHDFRNNTHLSSSQPVLCASCHYSPALDLQKTGPAGTQVGHKTMSTATHGYHASRITTTPPSGITCYYCHPGETTKCNRGAMSTAGLVCTGLSR